MPLLQPVQIQQHAPNLNGLNHCPRRRHDARQIPATQMQLEPLAIEHRAELQNAEALTQQMHHRIQWEFVEITGQSHTFESNRCTAVPECSRHPSSWQPQSQIGDSNLAKGDAFASRVGFRETLVNPSV